MRTVVPNTPSMSFWNGDSFRPSLLRIIPLVLLLLLRLLVDLLLTLQDLLHELQRIVRRLAIAERILNRLGTERLGRICGLRLRFDLLRVAAFLIVRGRLLAGG